jgi:hypothetical protein
LTIGAQEDLVVHPQPEHDRKPAAPCPPSGDALMAPSVTARLLENFAESLSPRSALTTREEGARRRVEIAMWAQETDRTTR